MKKFDNLCCTNKLATTGNQSINRLGELNAIRSELSDVRSNYSKFVNSHLDDRFIFKSSKSSESRSSKESFIHSKLLKSVLNSNSPESSSSEISTGSRLRKESPAFSIDLKSIQLFSSDVRSNLNSLSDSTEVVKDLKIDSNLSSHLIDHEVDESPNRNFDRISYLSKVTIDLFSTLGYLIFSSPFNRSQCSSVSLKSFYLIVIILLLVNPSSAGINRASNSEHQNTLTYNINSNVTFAATDQTIQTTIKRATREDRAFGIQVFGIRLEGERVEIKEDQTTSVFSNHNYNILLYGINFLKNSSDLRPPRLCITATPSSKGEDCSIYSRVFYNLTVISDTIARANINFSPNDADKSNYYYICIEHDKQSVHQGDENWMLIHVQNKLLPLWLQILFIFILLCLAGLFSGLNLGLMALDLHELEVIESCGTATEKRYARRIKPVRKRGNYLLCTILLGNVMVQTTLTVLLEDLTSGLIAVMGSTFSIVVFGEIVPQAICSRQGLAIGANTVFLMWFFMFLTFPISFPISWALDRVLGKEIGKIYDRDRLTEYLRITQRYNKLDSDELNIIQGALKLKKIKVDEIMTKLEDIFSLPVESVLNFNTLTMIQKSGYSRIPVYDTDKSNIVAVLFAKDLAFVDPDDKIPIQTLCQYYRHEISYIFTDATCYSAFTQFKEGKSHMAFVVRVSEEMEETDPHYEVLGLVTLEDVLEEVLQTEIVDETDVLTDNRRKKRRKDVDSVDYAEFCLLNSESQHVVSPQMVLVSYQYLSTSVNAFSKRYINENVLRELINQNVYHKEEPISYYSDVKICNLYEQGKSYDYFVLILEGYVQVTVSKEHLTFQSGPFTVFGSSCLKLQDEDNLTIESLDRQMNEPFAWVSDYTVEVEKVTYLKLNRNLYISAVRQSLEQNLNSVLQENKENSHLKSNDIQSTFNGLKQNFVKKLEI